MPLIAAIIGEGGSGGAIALAAGNRVLMLEHAVYSVISPEGCASILWRSAEQAKEAAEALKLTAEDLLKLGIIDEIVLEPLGGAHRDRNRTIESLGDAIECRAHRAQPPGRRAPARRAPREIPRHGQEGAELVSLCSGGELRSLLFTVSPLSRHGRCGACPCEGRGPTIHEFACRKLVSRSSFAASGRLGHGIDAIELDLAIPRDGR